MKKWKLFFTTAVPVFLIGISVFSCQMNDTDEYFQEPVIDVTPTDLFIASEAYQNFEKEIRRSMRRRHNAIDKLSNEEKVQYQELMEQVLNPETRMEAKEQLNILLGYDEQTERNRILVMAQEVYEGANISTYDLLRAWQKRRMHQVVISTRSNDVESSDECLKKCKQAMEQDVDECYAMFNECLTTVPAVEKLNKRGPAYDACVSSQDFCLDGAYIRWYGCIDRCMSSSTK